MSLSRFFKPVEKKRPRSPEVIEILDDDVSVDDVGDKSGETQDETDESSSARLLLSDNKGVLTNEKVGERGVAQHEVLIAEKQVAIDESHSVARNENNSLQSGGSRSDKTIVADEPEATVEEDDEAILETRTPEPKSSTVQNQEDGAASTSESNSTNPFAKFAFQQGSGNNGPILSSFRTKPVNPPLGKQPNDKDRPKKKQKKTEWVRMCELPSNEQDRIVTKWHSFVNASACTIEEARFQILVAARLHARCQEGPVRQALQSLRQKLDNALTVERLAQANPEDLHAVLSNLQYYRTKASHLVKAAQEIQSRFSGKVPQEDSQLRLLTGIGPVFADLLAFVNTRKVHRNRRSGGGSAALDTVDA